MRALYSAFFSRFCLPRQLHSDQDSNFESKFLGELCSIAGINKTRTTPCHPRSDGQTERARRTILQMLRASIDAQPESWPDRLPALLAAYRMTPHSVTGISHNMAILGREVLLPALSSCSRRRSPSQSQPLSRPIFAKTCAMRMRPFAARPAALRKLKKIISTNTSRGLRSHEIN